MLLLEHIEILSIEEKEKFLGWLKLELSGGDPFVLAMASGIIENEGIDLSVSPMLANRVIRSKLLYKLQEFIAIETFKRDQAQKDLYFMKGIFERKQEQHFPKFHKKALKRLKKQYAPSANYFHYLFQFEWFSHIHAIKRTPRKERKENFIGKRSQYLVNWLKHEIALLQLHYFQKEPVHPNFGELMTWLDGCKTDKTNTEELDLFFSLKDLFSQNSESHSKLILEQKVMATLRNSQSVSKSKSFTDLQLKAVNYFIKKAEGNPTENSLLQLHELYDWMLKNRLIPFTVKTFRTMSMTHLTLAYLQKDSEKKQYYLKQAQAFMEKSKKQLPLKEQENAYLFMKAYQDFILKNYSSVTKGDIFKSNDKPDAHYEFGYQFILQQKEYEIGNLAEIGTNLRYLGDRIRKRKDLNERSLITYNNRIRIFRKLIRTDDLPALKKLRKEIKETRLLGGRVWLLEKIQEKIDQFIKA